MRGPFGFRRLTSLGPLSRDEKDIIYHFTDEKALESILQNGFEMGYQQSIEAAGINRGAAIASHAGLDKSIDEFRPRRFSYLPNRFGSNFFFPDRIRPEKVLNKRLESGDRSGRRFAVAVDSSRIPCAGARGSYPSAKEVNQFFFNKEGSTRVLTFPEGTSKPDMVDVKESEVSREYKKLVRDYWNSVELYRGQDASGYEVWFNCPIPPEAIIGVVDPLG